jgi:hypothetical protein
VTPVLSGVGETMTLVGDCVATVWAAGDGAVQAAYIHPDDLAEINKARACDAGVTDPARLAAWMVRFRFTGPVRSSASFMPTVSRLASPAIGQ